MITTKMVAKDMYVLKNIVGNVGIIMIQKEGATLDLLNLNKGIHTD